MRLARLTAPVLVVALVVAAAPAASAYRFSRALNRGDRGADVKALQVRIAGWYPNSEKVHFALDGIFGDQTARAVRRFESHYGLTVDGVANRRVFARLARLEDGNGSTKHFDYSEFRQNRNPKCSREANSYAGTFKGGAVRARKVRRNVRRLMWRLEALRAKLGGHPIGINSGFRSRPYNRCIGGARYSQHLYGTAADLRVADVSNRRARDVSKASQVHGIACYSEFRHNHLDIRLDNHELDAARYWYWPKQDRRDRDLAEDGGVCWGEPGTRSAAARAATSGTWALFPSVDAVRDFADSIEPDDLHGLD
jgi:zinc D-Ala-D-Ala carboxypeptidase